MALTNADYFCDSYDWYAAANASYKYNGGGTFNSMISGAAPTTRYSYGQAANQVGSSGPVHNWAADKEYLICGFASYQASPGANLLAFESILGGASRLTLKTTSGGILKLDGDSGLGTLATSLGGIYTASTWHHIGLGIRVADATAGSVYLWRNSELVASATGIDTRAIAARSIGSFFYNGSALYDDLWIVRGDGFSLSSLEEEWEEIGDIRFTRYMPPSDGDDSDGAPSSGGDNFEMVNEIPTDSSDYNTLSTVGDRDLFPMGSLDASVGAIKFLQATTVAMRAPSSGTPQTFKNVLKSGSLQYGVSHSLADTEKAFFDTWVVNPFTGLPFGKTAVEAMQRGYEKTA
ncbi:MAG TPA: hypothetical protein VFD43_12415 [Planctomycetota bacterium]|nr:hypothetical protein [Planctomycetota bacterium]